MVVFPPDVAYSWEQEAISFIPITQFSFSKAEINKDKKLDHGYNDISFFPTWQEFLNRSTGKNPNYPNYMTFLMCKPKIIAHPEEDIKHEQQIIGVIAVQLVDFDSLQEKNFVVVPEINNYLYLSWIALDCNYQSNNYFFIQFEYYYSLIRRFRTLFNINVEGAAIMIRRMRPVFWSLFNDGQECPTGIDKIIKKQSPRFKITLMPIEIVDESITPKQDHALILFKQRKV
jgi:hypothetical protein